MRIRTRAWIARVLCDPARGLEAVDAWHLDVHQHDVGLQPLRRRDGLLAVARLADHGDAFLGLEDQPEAAAHERLIVGEDDLDHWRAAVQRERRVHREPALRRLRPARRWPPCRPTRSRMPISPCPPTVPGGSPVPAAVVEHFDLEHGRLVVDAHRGGRPAGVPEGVRERFLDDAIGGHLERAGQRPRLPLDRELDRQPALPGLGDELGQLGEIRLRRQLVGLIGAAEEAEQPVQLEHGLAAGVLDRAEHLLGLGGLLRHDAPRRAGLHAHHADVVGDDVVQLARDPHPLLEHGAAGVLLPLALQLARPCRELALAIPPRPDRQTEQDRKGDGHGVVGEQNGLVEGQILHRPRPCRRRPRARPRRRARAASTATTSAVRRDLRP